MGSGRSWRCDGIRTRMACLAVLTLVATASLGAGFPPPTYSAREIRATVVDEQSGQPLADVVVAALWILQTPGGERPRLHVAETVTSIDGTFTIPAWGPKPRPPLTALRDESPLLITFRAGYVPLRLHTESRVDVEHFYPTYRTMPTRQLRDLIQWFRGSPDDAVQDCIWTGLTLQMERFGGLPVDWFRHLRDFNSVLRREDARYTRQLHEALHAQRSVFGAGTAQPSEFALQSFFAEIEERLKEAHR